MRITSGRFGASDNLAAVVDSQSFAVSAAQGAQIFVCPARVQKCVPGTRIGLKRAYHLAVVVNGRRITNTKIGHSTPGEKKRVRCPRASVRPSDYFAQVIDRVSFAIWSP